MMMIAQRSLQRAKLGALWLTVRQPTRGTSSWNNSTSPERPTWSEEWKTLGLGAQLVDSPPISNLFFVQMGFGVDQHGDNSATKAAVRAVRNAIEFNSIPGVVESIGRDKMLIHVKLGVPPTDADADQNAMPVDVFEVAKVFPYGRLLPIDVVVGGLSFHTGRLVPELGDDNDLAVCVAACVSIGYNNGSSDGTHKVYSTKDGL